MVNNTLWDKIKEISARAFSTNEINGGHIFNSDIKSESVSESVPVSSQDVEWRRLSSTQDVTRLNPLDQTTLLTLVRWLYYNNPAARRLVEIPVDFQYNVSVRADAKAHPGLQEIIKGFWDDPYNSMSKYIGQYIERYSLDGELLLPTDINPQNGKVKIKFEETEKIKKIEALADDKRFVETVELMGEGGLQGKVYKVIRYNDDPSVKVNIGEATEGNYLEKSAVGYRVGNAFYFRQCHLVTGRGRPPLEPVIDWLDAHDHTLFDQLRNIALQGAHVWDVKLLGATPQQVEERKKQLSAEGPPKPGSVRIHNDSEEWEALSPKIDGTSAEGLLVEVRKYFGFGMAKSETWVAAADDVNRATALVADSPPYKHLKRQQDEIKWIINEMIDYVIDQAILHGTITIKTPEERQFIVDIPDLTTTDNKDFGESLKVAAEALSLAVDAKLIDVESAREIFFKVIGEPPSEDIEDKIESDDKKRSAQDYNRVDINKLLKGTSLDGTKDTNSNSSKKQAVGSS